MEKDKRLVRILRLAYQIAQKPGITFKDYASYFGVSERTIRRDVKALSSAGFHIENTTGLRFNAEDIIPVSLIYKMNKRKDNNDVRVSNKRKTSPFNQPNKRNIR